MEFVGRPDSGYTNSSCLFSQLFGTELKCRRSEGCLPLCSQLRVCSLTKSVEGLGLETLATEALQDDKM